MRVSFFSTQMRYFAAVVQAGSVSQAALHLHVAASAVSRQIAKLEDTLGVVLFERRQRGMVPTAAGERLMSHLRAGMDDAERVIEAIRGLAGEAARRVRLACTEGFATGFVPAAVTGFRQLHPEVQFELHVAAPDEVSRLLLRGEVDLALKYCAAPETGVQVLHGTLAPLLAVMSPAHPLARKRVVRLAEVVAYPLAVGSPGVTARQLLDLACSMQGLHYRASVVSNFSSALLPLMHGHDVVLSGYLSAAHLIADGRVVAVPFADTQMHQRRAQLMSLQPRDALSAMVQAFAGFLTRRIELHGRRRLGRRAAASAAP